MVHGTAQRQPKLSKLLGSRPVFFSLVIVSPVVFSLRCQRNLQPRGGEEPGLLLTPNLTSLLASPAAHPRGSLSTVRFGRSSQASAAGTSHPNLLLGTGRASLWDRAQGQRWLRAQATTAPKK